MQANVKRQGLNEAEAGGFVEGEQLRSPQARESSGPLRGRFRLGGVGADLD